MFHIEELKKCGLICAAESHYIVNYSADASGGCLDVDRLVNGRSDYWRKVVPATDINKKKKLVVTDWSLSYGGIRSSADLLVSFLQALLKQGFELYIWTGKLTKHNPSEDDLDTQLGNVVPICDKDLIAICAEQSITVDEVKILNYFSLRKLCRDLMREKRIIPDMLDVEDLIELDDDIFSQVLLSMRDMPMIGIYVSKKFSYWQKVKNFITQLLSRLTIPQIAFKASYWDKDIMASFFERDNLCKRLIKLDLSDTLISDAEAEEIFSRASQLEVLNLVKCSNITKRINLNKLSNLKEIDIRKGVDDGLEIDRINFSEFLALIKTHPQLKKIYCVFNGEQEGPVLLNEENKIDVKLEELYVGNAGNIDRKWMPLLFQLAPYLKKLTLSTRYTCENMIWNHIHFPVLKKLAIYGDTGVSDILFDQFRCRFPCLEKIYLLPLPFMGEIQNDIEHKHSLSNLKIIKLGHGCISLNQLVMLLPAVPDVTGLYVSGYNYLEEKINLEGVSLDKVQLLDLSSSPIPNYETNKLSADIVSVFLQKMPHLRKLVIKDRTITKSITLALGSLPELVDITLVKTEISIESLSCLLQAAPNVLRLNLSDGDYSWNNFTLSAGSLVKLEELDLSSSCVDIKGLETLLLAAPNLVKLKLYQCDNFYCAEELNLGGQQWPYLQYLTASYNSLTPESLNTLMRAVPFVKRLSIDCELELFSSLQGLRFPFIRSLSLCTSNFDERKLLELLPVFPNLVKIKFHNFTFVFKGEMLPINLAYPSLKYMLVDNVSRVEKYFLLFSLRLFPELRRILFLGSEIYDLKPLFSHQNMKKIKYLHMNVNCPALELNVLYAKYPNIVFLFEGEIENKYNKESVLDANTSHSDSTKHINQIFRYKENQSPHPLVYGDEFHFEIGPDFNLLPQKPIIEYYLHCQRISNLEKIYETQYEDSEDYFFGNNLLEMNSKEWKKLCPSLSCYDELVCIDSSIAMDVGRCQKTGLFYVKPKIAQNKPVPIKFIVKKLGRHWESFHDITDEAIHELTDRLIDFFTIYKGRFYFDARGEIFPLRPNLVFVMLYDLAQFRRLSEKQKVLMLAVFFGRFTEGKLEGNLSNKAAILHAIITQQKGACRHRAFAFVVLAKNLGLNARQVGNASHIFVEVALQTISGTERIRMNLGGYPVRLEITPVLAGLTPENIVDLTQKELLLDVAEDRPAFHDNPFVTGISPPAVITTYAGYSQFLLEQASVLMPHQRQVLVICESQDHIEQLNKAIVRHVVVQGKNHFYLHHFDEVIKKTLVIREDGSYEIQIGALLRFLQNGKQDDVFIVNWSHYKLSHVGYNTILDEERKFEDILVPEGMLVIAAITKDKIEEMGEDFYSRCKQVHQCPALIAQDEYANVSVPFSNDSALSRVHLYGGFNWERDLLGNVLIDDQKFVLKKGALIEVIEKGREGLVITNPPWHDALFRQFCSNLLIKREVFFNGKIYSLPEHFNLHCLNQSYEFDGQYMISQVDKPHPSSWEYSLNAQTWGHYFSNYRCQDQCIHLLPGWLLQYRGRTMSILVTDTLSGSQWSCFLAEANKYDVKLNLIVLHDVKLPGPMLQASNNLAPQEISETEMYPQRVRVVISNDIDLCEQQLLQGKESEYLTVSIDENKRYEDVIEKISHQKTDDGFSFRSQIGSVWKALQSGTTVILKGCFHKQLTKKLETLCTAKPYLWVNGEKQFLRGRLVIITDDVSLFSFKEQEIRQYGADECWKVLRGENISTLQAACAVLQRAGRMPFSYAQLKSMAEQHRKARNPIKPFLLLKRDHESWLHISREMFPHMQIEKGMEETDIVKKRLDKITAFLECSPYVFIAGHSGTGKSTFVLKELSSYCQTYHKSGFKLFVGEENLEKWVNAKSAGWKILFLDEANLEQRGKWEMFEGLFSPTPGLLINGQFCLLTPAHKIIFAGNFSYYQGRQEHSLFKRHGAVMVFKELPSSFLLSQIILPLLQKAMPSLDEKYIILAANQFLGLYHFTNQNVERRPLTPRNLQMMALRFVCLMGPAARDRDIAGADICLLALVAGYDEVSYFLTAELKQTFFGQYREDIKRYKQAKNETLVDVLGAFKITKSRRNPLRLLHDQLVIRDWRCQHPEFENTGTRGILIEGESGIGKSYMVICYLAFCGYRNGLFPVDSADDKRPTYYYLTPTDPARMRGVLHQAFHEGAIVIIDELNTLSVERELNTLLMGTDFVGQQAQHPGFFVIATQNPITYKNRQALSPALENRFYKISLKEYSPDELLEICLHAGMHPVVPIVGAFMQARKNIEPDRHMLRPNIRHLLDCQRYEQVDPCKYQYLLLNEAVKQKDLVLLQRLLQLSSLVLVHGTTTPLHVAVKMQYKEAARLLLEGKREMLFLEDGLGRTPLHYAVGHSDLDMLEDMLRAGAGIEVQDRQGETLLHLATKIGNKNMVARLLALVESEQTKRIEGNERKRFKRDDNTYPGLLFQTNVPTTTVPYSLMSVTGSLALPEEKDDGDTNSMTQSSYSRG